MREHSLRSEKWTQKASGDYDLRKHLAPEERNVKQNKQISLKTI